MSETGILPASTVESSFRDPCGFVFRRSGTLFRQINTEYAPHYAHLIDSGLYSHLTASGALVRHDEAPETAFAAPDGWKVLRPEVVPFVAHPYEWCFGQWRDAALLTLAIQRDALAHGMWLKDASAFNIQFRDGRPLLIDTLSLEIYPDGAPWPAYRQFCQHFLAPLALMARVDPDLGQWLRVHLDGVPLGLASRLLPPATRWNPLLAAHLHLHARQQRRLAATDDAPAAPPPRLDRRGLLALVDSLESAVRQQRWEPRGTEWGDYYAATNYTDDATAAKTRLVAEMIDQGPAPRTVWDLGANTGRFSRLAAERGAFTVAWDIDPAAVEILWRDCRANATPNLLPLRLDLANPSPALGWDLSERASLLERGPADLVLALALVHHLAIGNNVPLPRVAAFLARCAPRAVVEFVPREDSQTQRLLRGRRDIFSGYTREGFEAALAPHWRTVRAVPIPQTCRTLYLLERTP